MINDGSCCPLCGGNAGQYAYGSCIRPAGLVGCMKCSLTGRVLPDVYPYFPYSTVSPCCRARRSFRQ